MESIDSIEKYAYGMRKYLLSEKEEVKCNNIINRMGKDLLSEKEEIKCNNITKRHKNVWLSGCFKRKHKRT